ncbi:5-oxoprolinase subunit C family protein [Vibrio panuliri]|uniref:Allophanate hydrolase n=1 Tax=Vibrio panuliri TaxID=1381081 RepID=A0ABX3FF88_9VIBR|nr:biotin-dependent carboxyltransferase family protein [Vibrio panuliri]KAB1457359.1 biotin-dependent carboxyltransferase family protein [Vibrio panuliri]OLQ91481.1 allophanate hydrolase [Vibrio panuliri]
MSKAELKVLKPGPLSLIQDLGRFGHAHTGITQGGPLDEYAYSWANYLLGNKVNLPCIEITLGQTQFEVGAKSAFSICGANLNATLDDIPITNWSSFIAKQGQVIRFSLAKNGLRAYLGVLGGFDVPLAHGSCSTVQRDQLGGLVGGNALKQGDRIRYHSLLANQYFEKKQLSFRYQPDYDLPITLRVVEGYQKNVLPKHVVEWFYHTEFEVSKNIDRMGYRLQGSSIDMPTIEMRSEGIALGAIQLPPDGQPIVLLNDRQTIGGYPKIGCVSRIDLPRLAQAKPGQKVRFVKGHLDELQSDWVMWANYFGY